MVNLDVPGGFPNWQLSFVSLREVKLSVVSYLTNSVVDQILQELYATHKTLVFTLPHSSHRLLLYVRTRSI